MLDDKRVTVGLYDLFSCWFLCLFLPSHVGLAGDIFLVGRGVGVFLGGGAEPYLHSVLLGPFKNRALDTTMSSVTLLVT